MVETFQRGAVHAVSSERVLARAWSKLFAVFDDYEFPEEVVDLAWMPAHTPAGAIGTVLLSNGDALTEADREGNARADKLAKMGAEMHRVPRLVRERFRIASEAADYLARALGVVTYSANHHPTVCNLPATDGPTSKFMRDSTATGAWRQAARAMATAGSGVSRRQPAVTGVLASHSRRTCSALPVARRRARSQFGPSLVPGDGVSCELVSLHRRSSLPMAVLEERVASLIAAARGS